MFKKVIREGERMPNFYGLAYRDFSRFEVVCYPIVMNLIVRYLRELYFIVAIPADFSRSEHIVQEAYRRGYEDGLEAGIQMESCRQKNEERNKDDVLLSELEGYIMGYLRKGFRETDEKVTGDF